jgi:mRNA interferase RelE/StbE
LTWHIEWDERARKELRSLDIPVQKKILKYLRERASESPRSFGRELVGNKAGLWRYRIEDYRLICKLKDNQLVIFVVAVGHRKEIYD